MSRLIPRSRKWNDLPLRQKSLIVVAVPLLSLLLNSSLFYFRHQVEEDAENWVTHSLNVQVEVARLLPEIFEAQRYARSYGAHHKKADWQSYQDAAQHLQETIDHLNALVVDRPVQLEAARSLGRAVSERLSLDAELARVSRGRKIDEQELSERVVASTLFIRDKSRQMQTEETRLLEMREKRLQRIRRADYVAVGGTLLIGLLGGLISMRLLMIGILRRTEDLQVAVGLIAEGREWRPSETANDEIGYVSQGLARTGELLAHRASAMREANAKLQAVLNSATQFGIIGADCEGEITLFNTGAERMFGYPAAEVVGRPLVATLHVQSEIDARVKQLSESCCAEVEPFEALVLTVDTQGFDEREWTLVRRDKSLLAADVVITPQRDSRNQLIGFLFVSRDVSRQKEAENLLHEAKRKAEEASLAKSHFLACMSHEIRTPMNAICGMADLLLETKLDEEQREYTKIFRASSDWLLKLINDILDLSKVESGKLELELLPFNLEEAVKQTVELITPQAHRKGLDIACEISTPVNFVGDRQRLQQILFNLLGNAIKFTDHGQVVLRVKTQVEGLVRFSVTDTGRGISALEAERIFDPFQQADVSISRRFGGTGLGLAITKGLVESMQGRIWVESGVGAGCTFIFDIPHRSFEREEHPELSQQFVKLSNEVAAREEKEPGEAVESVAARQDRILVVDDTPPNLFLIKAFLKNQPYDVATAFNGAEAVELQQTNRYDLILMDVQMPVVDGYTATGMIRQDERTRGLEPVPIIALTANALKGEADRSKAAGCTGYLSKPVRREALLEMMREAIASSRQGQLADV